MKENYTKRIKEEVGSKYNCSGIYSISVNNKIVYIGKSTNMFHRIITHISCINRHYPLEKKYEYLHLFKEYGGEMKFDILFKTNSEEELGEMEGKFIREYMPVLNANIPLEEDQRKCKRKKLPETFEEFIRAVGLKLVEYQNPQKPTEFFIKTNREEDLFVEVEILKIKRYSDLNKYIEWLKKHNLKVKDGRFEAIRKTFEEPFNFF